jgi:hypothetical protein
VETIPYQPKAISLSKHPATEIILGDLAAADRRCSSNQ